MAFILRWFCCKAIYTRNDRFNRHYTAIIQKLGNSLIIVNYEEGGKQVNTFYRKENYQVYFCISTLIHRDNTEDIVHGFIILWGDRYSLNLINLKHGDPRWIIFYHLLPDVPVESAALILIIYSMGLVGNENQYIIIAAQEWNPCSACVYLMLCSHHGLELNPAVQYEGLWIFSNDCPEV